jgi:hypothetical protein
MRATCPGHFVHPTLINLLIMQSPPASCHFLSLRSKYSAQHLVLRHCQSMFFP